MRPWRNELGKVMTVGGKPYKVNPAEQLSVSCFWPGSNASYSQAFNPSTIGPTPVNYYATSWLDGVNNAPSFAA